MKIMKRPNLLDYTKGLDKREWGYAVEKYHQDNEHYIDYLESKFNNDLRDKFFNECTDDPKNVMVDRKINITPHNLFEWFRKNVLH